MSLVAKLKTLTKFITFKNFYFLILFLCVLKVCGKYSGGFTIYWCLSFSVFLLGVSFFSLLTNNYKLGFSLSSSVFIILELLHRLKKSYYNEFLVFQDFSVISDVSNAEILLQYPSALAAFVFFTIFPFFNIWLFYRDSAVLFAHKPKNIGLNFAFCLILFSGVYGILNYDQKALKDGWLANMPWGKGSIVNLIISYMGNSVEYSPPVYLEGDDYFLVKTAELKPEVVELSSKPDVVILLQESTFNPLFFDFKNPHDIPKMGMFGQGSSGLLRVQTYGGRTWVSEFAMLSGLNPADFGVFKTAVFYVVVQHLKYSLFKQFVDEGYEIIMLAPSKNAYNSTQAYTLFGVNQILTAQDFPIDPNVDYGAWTLPTSKLLDFAKQLLRDKKDKPRLIYMTSSAEHGHYRRLKENKYNISDKLPEKKLFELNDYTNRIVALNDATLEFIDYVKKREDKTLFFYFGDHQPAINKSKDFKVDFRDYDYITHFSLVSNYKDFTQKVELADLSLMSGLVLEQAGIKPNSFYEANIKMRKACGWLLDDCPDQKLVNSYKSYLYNNLKVAGVPGRIEFEYHN